MAKIGENQKTTKSMICGLLIGNGFPFFVGVRRSLFYTFNCLNGSVFVVLQFNHFQAAQPGSSS